MWRLDLAPECSNSFLQLRASGISRPSSIAGTTTLVYQRPADTWLLEATFRPPFVISVHSVHYESDREIP